MKITTIVFVVLLMAPASAFAQRLQIDHLDRLVGQAEEAVNVDLDAQMLTLALSVMKGNDAKQAAARELISGLNGVFVRVLEFAKENVYAEEDLNMIRKQVAAPGWSRVFNVYGKRDRKTMEVFLWRNGDQPGGLAVLIAEPTELVVVNIVGAIDLSKLIALQGQFGIPNVFGTDDKASGNRQGKD